MQDDHRDEDDRDVDETGDEATENDNETRSMSQSETSQDLLTPEVTSVQFLWMHFL